MKRLVSIALAALLSVLSLSARPVKQLNIPVTGHIVDVQGNPVGFATVSIEKSDSTVVCGTAADESGSFRLDSPAGEYTLAVRLIGYKDLFRAITVKGPSVDMGTITIDTDAEMLAGATITEKVKLVEMKIDKLVMNISQSAFAQGSNALDLMRKAPGVTIDKDGNIKLNGSAVEVWIDGRPSYASGKTLEALLRATDGGSIDKFEIMAHPSAKYDASGQGGIINIKTKKTIFEGLNGNAGFEYGGMYFGDIDKYLDSKSAWVNLNYRRDKSRSFVNLYEAKNRVSQLEKVSNILQGEGMTFGQESETLLQFKSDSYQLKLGHDWFLDDKNTVGAIVTVPVEKEINFTPKDKSWTRRFIGDDVYQFSETEINMDSRILASSANLNFTHTFNPQLAREVTVNADYYYHDSNDDNLTNIYSRTARSNDMSENSRHIVTDRDINIYSVKADYQSVIFNRYMLEAGAKWALSRTYNVTDHDEKATAMSFDNKFNYSEHVTAAYASFSGQFGPKVAAKFGVRAEYTASKGDWMSIGEVTKDSYLDFFPTAYIGYNTEKARLSLSYTRRINRPSYSQLNPTPVFIDADNYIVGNPELKPQYMDALQAIGGFGQHLQVVLMYAYSGGVVSQSPVFLEDGSEAFVWSNFGSISQPAAVVSVTELPFTKWLTWTANGTFAYAINKDKSTGYKQSAPVAQVYTCLTATLPKDWKIQLDLTAMTNVKQAYFKIHPIKYSDLSVKKIMMQDRLTLTMSVNDVFRSMTSDLEVNNMPGVVSSTVFQTPYRQKVNIGLDWSFGKATRTRARNVGNLEEIDRTK